MTLISLSRLFTIAMLLALPGINRAQNTFFYQDFSKKQSFVNSQPDLGQFSHIIQTAPALSYAKFQNGYMELVRTQRDSVTGGIIRVLCAEPFRPNPETLFIQIKMSADAIPEDAVNALYFYVGENFNPVNHSFPSNALMFGKCAIHFQDGKFLVKDLATQASSQLIGKKKIVTLSWVLNNSARPFEYKLSPSDAEIHTALPGTYDLWVDNEPVNLGSKAYPGNSLFSEQKLSNFEIRFRNGLGKVRIHEMLIREGISDLEKGEVMIAPNPTLQNLITLRAADVDLSSVRLFSLRGTHIPVESIAVSPDQIQLYPNVALISGVYIVAFTTNEGKFRTLKVMVN